MAACVQEEDHSNPGSFIAWSGANQPESREGQAGRDEVTVRLVGPMKPGNSGRGKGPQFKINATSGEEREIGKPSNSAECSEAADGVTGQSEGKPKLSVLRPLRQDVSSRFIAIRLCKANQGAAGVDGERFEDIEAYGLDRWLGELAQELRNKRYQPQAARRVFIQRMIVKISECTDRSTTGRAAEEVVQDLNRKLRG